MENIMELKNIDLRPYKAVLFDLDATLAPYVQKEMSEVFFSAIEEFGEYKGMGASFGEAFNYAFKKMKQNDGVTLNRDVFVSAFYEKLPDLEMDPEELMDEFYGDYFKERVRHVVRYRGSEKAMLHHLRENGKTVICATNPVFPVSATVTRMSLSGFMPEDFDFVTHHFDHTYCKPRAEYFEEILHRFSLNADEAIMIGNDTLDDLGAPAAGIRTVLISDYLTNRGDIDVETVETITYENFLSSVYQLVDNK